MLRSCFSSTIDALLLNVCSGAFAQSPTAGEGPLFLNEIAVISSSNVRAPMSIQQVASGEQSGIVAVANDSAVTRAEVRQATLNAFPQSQPPVIGERS